MKKVILSVALMAFAIAVHAGDAKTTNTKEKSACCADKAALTTKASVDAKACSATKVATGTECSATKVAKGAECSTTASACSSSSAKMCKGAPAKQALLSPKAAAEISKL